MYGETVAQYCKRRHSEMKSDRSNFEDLWEDIARFLIPNRGDFNTKNQPGIRRHRHILDSTGTWAAEQLSNFLYGALTNPASHWFALGVYNPELMRREDVRRYLSLATAHMYSIFNNPRKKFYDHSHEVYNDIVPFGTGILFMEDRPGAGMSFRARALREVFLDEDYDGNVDVASREFDLTVRQLAQQFGEDALPDDIRRIVNKEAHRKFTVLHCIYPKDTTDLADMSRSNRMPYASIYSLMEKEHKLREGGFRRFPVLAPRWTKRSDEIYGRGPGSIALAEVRMLQKMKETTLKGGQKVVDPPLQVPDNTFLSPLNLTPGAVNYYNPIFDGDGAKPIITDSRPDFGVDLMDREKEAILRAFYADKLSSNKNPNVEQTRAEFLGDQNERLLLMAPQLGRMHTEYIGPLIEQTYFVERVTNRLPEPPEVLRGQPLVVQYKSPLARAQQLQRLQAVTGAVNDIVPMAQVFPEMLDSVDPDGLSQWIFMSHDTPAEVLRPEDEVARRREERKQQQEMQARLEQAEMGSKAVANVSKAMPQGGGRVAR